MIKTILEYSDYLGKLFGGFGGDGNDKRRVKTLTFQVTEACNLACSYCYEINKHPNYMTEEVAKKFIDDILAHRFDKDYFINEYNTKGLIIEFFGGEPLLNMPLINFITEYFETFFASHPECPWGVYHRYNITSNGTLYFNPEVQEYIKKYHNYIAFNITVDGCKAAHDECRRYPDGSPSYDKAIAAAVDAQKYNNFGTKITLAPNNIKYIYDSVLNLLNLGFYEVHMNCAFEEGWVIDDAKRLYEQLKKVADYVHDNDLYDDVYIKMLDANDYRPSKSGDLDQNWCGTTDGCMMALQPSGRIYNCCRFMDTSVGDLVKSWHFGNVAHGIAQTEEEKENMKVLGELSTRNQSDQKCLDCSIGSGCSFCTAYNYQHFGKFKRTTYICDCTLAGALAAKYLANIVGDRESFDLINIDKDWATTVISEEEFEDIFKWRNNIYEPKYNNKR